VAEYQPVSRRPIADSLRKTAHLAVRLCIRLNIHPDAISYLSIVSAALAGACFFFAGRWPVLLLVGPAFCYLRLWCNMLDGMVALQGGKASWRGEILNDLPDRISDVLIFVGLAHSTYCLPLGAYWAAIMALLIAYVGVSGQAVGVQREFSGIMSKPWRMVVVHLGAWATWVVLWQKGANVQFASLTVMDWANGVVLVGGIQSIFVRLKRILAALKTKSQTRGD
jgi:phosphatidylglycerophosphate synthase